MRRLQWLLPMIAIIGSGLVGLFYSSSTVERLQALRQVDSPTLLLSHSLSFGLNAVHEGFTYAVAAADKSAIAQAQDKARQLRDELARLQQVPAHADAAKAMSADFEAYVGAAAQVATAMTGGDTKGADPAALGHQMQSAHAALTKRLDELKTQTQDTLAGGISAAESNQKQGLVAGLLGLLLVLGVSIGVGRKGVRDVLQELGGDPAYAKHVVQRIAGGDLETPIRLRAGDQGSLLHAMQGMQTRLGRLLGDVSQCATAIDTSSSAIASGNADLSQRTTLQTDQLRGTASSIDQLTASVRDNAAKSQQANALALAASDEAGQGAQRVGQVVQTMHDILASSQRISDITGVIDGIAFQTNLLALNAAVEAARAGEQGRGFAVVASEVRGLAQRAGSAAREIKTLITDSTQRVDQGAQQAQEAGSSMDRLVGSVQRVGALISDISTATSQQRAGIEQVNEVVAELDSHTRRNAELAAQANQSSASLQAVSSQLAQMVRGFGNTTSTAAADAAPAP